MSFSPSTHKKETHSTLNKLYKLYSKYTKNPLYVYKICCDALGKETPSTYMDGSFSKKWIVIMKKISDTETNENRDGVIDDLYAKFRANKLLVVKIININNPKLTKKYIVNEYHCAYYGTLKLKYEVKKIVTPTFYDKDPNNICSGGIHYFKSLKAAYYYRDCPENYTGRWHAWHTNGRKRISTNYINGERSLYWIGWSHSGAKVLSGFCDKGSKNGKWTEWYENGKKKIEETYVDGKRHGIRTEWYENDNKKSEGYYFNGKKHGVWKEWFDNIDSYYDIGEIKYTLTYDNGNLVDQTL